MKILYVDDEIINLELFKLHLMVKYEVLTAADGEMGLDLMEQHPDLKVVISDMKMPKMDGLQFIIQAKDKLPEINYYLLTGYEVSREIESALDRGLISQYFKKPFDIDEIDHEIQANV